MEEIDFERLKVLLEGKTEVEFINRIGVPIEVRIESKSYNIIGITKTKLLEYFCN